MRSTKRCIVQLERENKNIEEQTSWRGIRRTAKIKNGKGYEVRVGYNKIQIDENGWHETETEEKTSAERYNKFLLEA